MNYQGSSRRLLGNARSAMVGAIEIYNKPHFEYRDEVFVLLLINAWELLLKALVSKAGQSIYYKKRRNQPYRTLSCADAVTKAAATALWPNEVAWQAVERNLDLLGTYRDNAVHFYNTPGFGTVIYSLAQTSIVSFRDLLRAVFKLDFGKEMNWALLPLGVSPPIDPITYLKVRPTSTPARRAIDQFLRSLREAAHELETAGIDTGRLLTVFDVSLQSIKKIESSDIVVGVGASSDADPVIVTRRLDPNVSHPYRRKEILERLAESGRSFSPYEFDAAVRHFGLRDNATYCWRDQTTDLTKWSPETTAFLLRLTPTQIEQAKSSYSERQRQAAATRRRHLASDRSPSRGN